MPDIFALILWPIKWVIELILVSFHSLWTFLGMNPDAGITWVLSIMGLVIVVRAAMIPLFVKQIKSQRRMLEIAPELKKIQDKYKGKKDQISREKMARETMELYQKRGTSPLSGCLPILVQMPIFFGLFSVLNAAQHQEAGVGALTSELAGSFSSATFFGAPLNATFINAMNDGGPWQVFVVTISMIVLMTATQFITQRQIMAKNLSDDAKNSPMFRQQQVLLYILPIVIAVSGIAFPIGVMMYWAISNIWTMGQQFVVIRNMPTPGSPAARARDERLARKGKIELTQPESNETIVTNAGSSKQRQQPVGKNRAKKKK